MAFRDILLALTTYPQPTPTASIEEAVGLAAALGARICAIACAVEVQRPGRFNAVADALLSVPEVAEAAIAKSLENARGLLAAFEASAQRQGVSAESIREACVTSQVAELLTGHARLRDLTMIPVPDGDHIERSYAEALLFGAGRPIMVLPATPKRPARAALDKVVVAWDSGRAAARAVADALPVLEKARLVQAVTIASGEAPADSRRPAEELTRYLALHGVTATLETIDAQGRTVADVLASTITARDPDLLVMGAYGHSRVREFVLGGATWSMLASPPLPILFSH